MTLLSNSRIAIIGGGLSGSFIGYLLSKKGFSDITIFERKAPPSGKRLGKVCGGCLHYRAIANLIRHGLGSCIEPSTEITSVSLISPEQRASFGFHHGSWVNRRQMDEALLSAAQGEGVFFQNQLARIVDARAGVVRYGSEEKRFDIVIGCGGVSDSALPEWKQERYSSGGFGVQGYFGPEDIAHESMQSILPGEVRFFIDEGGYHGVVKVGGTDPYFHVASYIRGTKLSTSPFLKQFFSLERLVETTATPPLKFKRQAAEGRVFLCGDSLGYPEPFSGEGMRFALDSAEKLSELVAHEFSTSTLDSGESAKRWINSVRILQRKQWRRCALATWVIEKPLRRKCLFPLAGYLAPIVSKVW